MGKGKGGGGTDTTTTSSEPPKYLLPYLQRAQKTAENLYKNRPLMRDPLNDQQRAGLSQQYGAGRNAEPPQTAADYATGQLGMDPQQQMDTVQQMANPYIEQFVPQANSAAAMMGRSGSGMAGNLMGEGIGRAVGEQYNNFLTHNDRLAAVSPMLEQSRYMPGQMMKGVGDQYYQNKQMRVNEPWQRFGQYTSSAFGNAPGMLAGGNMVQTGPSQTQGFNPFGAIAGIGSMLGGLGWSPFG